MDSFVQDFVTWEIVLDTSVRKFLSFMYKNKAKERRVSWEKRLWCSAWAWRC